MLKLTQKTDLTALNVPDVLAYTAHVPSFADTWGWVMVRIQIPLDYFAYL